MKYLLFIFLVGCSSPETPPTVARDGRDAFCSSLYNKYTDWENWEALCVPKYLDPKTRQLPLPMHHDFIPCADPLVPKCGTFVPGTKAYYIDWERGNDVKGDGSYEHPWETPHRATGEEPK